MEAEFSRLSNDLFWSFYTPSFEKITWGGYDDNYWWKNVSPTDNFRNRKDSKGNIYRLDPETNNIELNP